MSQKCFICLIFILLAVFQVQSLKYDLTILGEVNYEGSLTRIGINLVENLRHDLKINYIRTPRGKGKLSFGRVSEKTKSIILNNERIPGKVVLLVETLNNPAVDIYKKIRGKINIAYSMIESDQIPSKWVNRLNDYFDCVVVPDEYLVGVYKKSGVHIPIFVIPVPMNIDEFLNKPLKGYRGNPFTFGVSAIFVDRKNNKKLFNAFVKNYKNNKNFLLKIHGRYGTGNIYSSLMRKINKFKISNVDIVSKPLSQEAYTKFLSSIDCYVCISKGEGFSMTPREAMALGIPCILSDNSAQSTICKSGLVEVVPSRIKRPFYSNRRQVGFCYDCSTFDVTKAMKKVYSNYNKYLKLSRKARKSAEYYSANNISRFFLSLVKPKRVTLGSQNIVTKSGLVTNSPGLYQKYLNL